MTRTGEASVNQRTRSWGARCLIAGCVVGVTVISGAASATTVVRQQQYGGYKALVANSHAKVTVQAQLKVPAVTCPNVLPGVAKLEVRVESSKPIGDPNPAPDATAEIDATCSAQNAAPTYSATSTLGSLPLTVSPGDQVVLRAMIDPTITKERAIIDDETTGVTRSLAASTPGPNYQPTATFVGVYQANGPGAAYPDVGEFTWVHATMVGQPVSEAPALAQYALTGEQNSDVIIRTSVLSPSGSSFRNTWLDGGP
jgi:hypothetical protein